MVLTIYLGIVHVALDAIENYIECTRQQACIFLGTHNGVCLSRVGYTIRKYQSILSS